MQYNLLYLIISQMTWKVIMERQYDKKVMPVRYKLNLGMPSKRNKHGYAKIQGYSCKYTVCKLSSSSTSSVPLPIPLVLIILHQSLYFGLRLCPPPPSNKSVRMGYVRVIYQIMHVMVEIFSGTFFGDRQTYGQTDKVSYEAPFQGLKSIIWDICPKERRGHQRKPKF